MKPILSICMMVKNEEENLERCLESLQPLRKCISSELIIVDTGSTDRTVEIAKQFTHKVFFHEWDNDFSKMRNITINYAVGQWILIIDADEEIETADALVSFLKSSVNKEIGCVTILVKSIINSLSGANVTVISPRLFRRNNDFYYQGTVHNQPVFKGKALHLSNCSIIHYGYISNNKDLMERKFQRTSLLLQAELKKDPDNIYYRYQLSNSYSMHRDFSEAFWELQKIYESHKDADDAFWKSNLYVIGGLLRASLLNKCSNDEIVQLGLRGIRLAPEYVDLYFYIAQIYELQGNSAEAYEFYGKHEKLVMNFSKLGVKYNTSLPYDTVNLLTTDYFSMGVISLRSGNHTLAREHFEKLLKTAARDDALIDKTRFYIVEIDFIQKSFTSSRKIYDELLEKGLNEELLRIEAQMEKFYKSLQEEERRIFCLKFEDVNTLYGYVNQLRLLYDAISRETWQSIITEIMNIEINTLPDYYAPILLHSLKFYPQDATQISACLFEENIVKYFIYLDELDKAAFVNICSEFLNFNDEETVDSYQIARLRKNICKYLLFSREISDEEYNNIFLFYIQNGQSYMESIYHERVFRDELINDLKNKEETFLFYITLANRNTDEQRYLRYLEKALKAFPEMNKGIDGLLKSFRDKTNAVNNEMINLKYQLLKNVRTLLDAHEGALALGVLEEYEQICGQDEESLVLKSQAMLLCN